MSKLYLEYIKRKKEDNSKYYLFKSGIFYIFIGEDAKKISKITPLNLTNLNKEIVKCGFPENSLDKYVNIFNNLNLDIVIVNNISCDKKKSINDKVINKIKNIDINKITPVESLNILSVLKGMLVNE